MGRVPIGRLGRADGRTRSAPKAPQPRAGAGSNAFGESTLEPRPRGAYVEDMRKRPAKRQVITLTCAVVSLLGSACGAEFASGAAGSGGASSTTTGHGGGGVTSTSGGTGGAGGAGGSGGTGGLGGSGGLGGTGGTGGAGGLGGAGGTGGGTNAPFAATVGVGCFSGSECTGANAIPGGYCAQVGICTTHCNTHEDCGCAPGLSDLDIALGACPAACADYYGTQYCFRVCDTDAQCEGSSTCWPPPGGGGAAYWICEP